MGELLRCRCHQFNAVLHFNVSKKWKGQKRFWEHVLISHIVLHYYSSLESLKSVRLMVAWWSDYLYFSCSFHEHSVKTLQRRTSSHKAADFCFHSNKGKDVWWAWKTWNDISVWPLKKICRVVLNPRPWKRDAGYSSSSLCCGAAACNPPQFNCSAV